MASIQKRGKAWVAEICVDKRRKSKSFKTKGEAQRWANEQEELGIPDAKTVYDVIQRYRPIAETHKGAQSELSRLRQLEASSLAFIRLENLTPTKIAEYRDARLMKVSPVSVRRELIILSAMLKIAKREWGWLHHDPVVSVRKPTAGPARRRGVTQEEIGAICLNLSTMRVGKQVADMFLLSIETGMRLSEMLALTWDDVSEKSVQLRETKNGDRRSVPLSERAREIINRRRIDPEDVFTLSAHVVSKTFSRASINGVHFHDARSEAVTRLSRKLDVMQLARVIGHRDPRSLMFYYSESADEIADRL